MPKRCALGCSNKNSYHQFPHPEKNHDRFKAWVHIAGGKLDSPADYELYRKKVICDIHFTDRDRNRNNRLNFLAVPSLHLPGKSHDVDTSDKVLLAPESVIEESSLATLKPTLTVRSYTAPVKRLRKVSDEAKEPSNDTKKDKTQGSYKDVLTETKMAIVHASHPDEALEAGTLGPIQEFLWKLLVGTADPLPRVNVGNMVGGALHVSCEGPDAVRWLRNVDGQEIGGIKLRVVEVKDVPKPVKMAWRSKTLSGADLANTLRLLQRFNPALHTERWKVLKVDVEPTTTHRIVLMDKASADAIKEAGYTLHSGLGPSQFKLLEDADRQGAFSGAGRTGRPQWGDEGGLH